MNSKFMNDVCLREERSIKIITLKWLEILFLISLFLSDPKTLFFRKSSCLQDMKKFLGEIKDSKFPLSRFSLQICWDLQKKVFWLKTFSVFCKMSQNNFPGKLFFGSSLEWNQVKFYFRISLADDSDSSY